MGGVVVDMLLAKAKGSSISPRTGFVSPRPLSCTVIFRAQL